MRNNMAHKQQKPSICTVFELLWSSFNYEMDMVPPSLLRWTAHDLQHVRI